MTCWSTTSSEKKANFSVFRLMYYQTWSSKVPTVEGVPSASATDWRVDSPALTCASWASVGRLPRLATRGAQATSPAASTMANADRNRGEFLPVMSPVSPRLQNHRSEEHTSELQSLMRISYAVFCLKKKKQKKHLTPTTSKSNKQQTTS